MKCLPFWWQKWASVTAKREGMREVKKEAEKASCLLSVSVEMCKWWPLSPVFKYSVSTFYGIDIFISLFYNGKWWGLFQFLSNQLMQFKNWK